MDKKPDPTPLDLLLDRLRDQLATEPKPDAIGVMEVTHEDDKVIIGRSKFNLGALSHEDILAVQSMLISILCTVLHNGCWGGARSVRDELIDRTVEELNNPAHVPPGITYTVTDRHGEIVHQLLDPPLSLIVSQDDAKTSDETCMPVRADDLLGVMTACIAGAYKRGKQGAEFLPKENLRVMLTMLVTKCIDDERINHEAPGVVERVNLIVEEALDQVYDAMLAEVNSGGE